MVKENTDLAFFVPVFQREVTHGLGANTNLLSLLNLITILSANRYPTCILERHSPLCLSTDKRNSDFFMSSQQMPGNSISNLLTAIFFFPIAEGGK